MPQKKIVYIVIGCDTDPDRSKFIPGVRDDELSWTGMLHGIPRTKEQLKELIDAVGKKPVFTWCLRVDDQIKRYLGAYSSVLSAHKDFLLELERSGDELGWHPHFWRQDTKSQQWYQEWSDKKWQTDMLRVAHSEYQQVLPGRAKSAKMGWGYHNNETFATLEKLGVKLEFSALSGMAVRPPSVQGRGVNYFDWFSSPNRPYYPSRDDYRREAHTVTESVPLLEAPNFTAESFRWGMVAGLALALKMYRPGQIINSLRRPAYWITITGRPNLFQPLLDQLRRTLRNSDQVFFVTYFHPDEVIENKSSLYSLDYMKNNIRGLLKVVKSCGAEARYIQAREIAELHRPNLL
ncbi:MAG: hypothetical protein SGI97_05125 [candidate division Zixibacteria bacterium]|nr:hypothetical protein [candidate division Zixibacteria bacterium]